MAYTYLWLSSLPQKPKTDYAETNGVLIKRTSMDAGPSKQRRIGQRPDSLSVSFDMSTTQVGLFESFVKDTLKGTIRFGFPHPRTNEIVEVRIVPQNDGALYDIKYVLPELWTVSFKLEILP